ncbi:hypothetical protein P152DRAFT_485375 [Eremomyces bilateralis CBS 781.70]|uniref:Uncharacterized protein n=1 Tax=Eremomyces bilateralis CBS 781.70 TaxID=1392243 RepID=A0A6G1FSC1_9PEZI|nr:uncharacterized protein P152DRAFT_485375 [Eremomyces bilateralis CBS 781.70]KAF1808572.1 hypothetical protein P152DRAFT_485375 [Eremomyces bilateralis CBS 781.70]
MPGRFDNSLMASKWAPKPDELPQQQTNKPTDHQVAVSSATPAPQDSRYVGESSQSSASTSSKALEPKPVMETLKRGTEKANASVANIKTRSAKAQTPLAPLLRYFTQPQAQTIPQSEKVNATVPQSEKANRTVPTGVATHTAGRQSGFESALQSAIQTVVQSMMGPEFWQPMQTTFGATQSALNQSPSRGHGRGRGNPSLRGHSQPPTWRRTGRRARGHKRAGSLPNLGRGPGPRPSSTATPRHFNVQQLQAAPNGHTARPQSFSPSQESVAAAGSPGHKRKKSRNANISSDRPMPQAAGPSAPLSQVAVPNIIKEEPAASRAPEQTPQPTKTQGTVEKATKKEPVARNVREQTPKSAEAPGTVEMIAPPSTDSNGKLSLIEKMGIARATLANATYSTPPPREPTQTRQDRIGSHPVPTGPRHAGFSSPGVSRGSSGPFHQTRQQMLPGGRGYGRSEGPDGFAEQNNYMHSHPTTHSFHGGGPGRFPLSMRQIAPRVTNSFPSQRLVPKELQQLTSKEIQEFRGKWQNFKDEDNEAFVKELHQQALTEFHANKNKSAEEGQAAPATWPAKVKLLDGTSTKAKEIKLPPPKGASWARRPVLKLAGSATGTEPKKEGETSETEETSKTTTKGKDKVVDEGKDTETTAANYSKGKGKVVEETKSTETIAPKSSKGKERVIETEQMMTDEAQSTGPGRKTRRMSSSQSTGFLAADNKMTQALFALPIAERVESSVAIVRSAREAGATAQSKSIAAAQSLQMAQIAVLQHQDRLEAADSALAKAMSILAEVEQQHDMIVNQAKISGAGILALEEISTPDEQLGTTWKLPSDNQRGPGPAKVAKKQYIDPMEGSSRSAPPRKDPESPAKAGPSNTTSVYATRYGPHYHYRENRAGKAVQRKKTAAHLHAGEAESSDNVSGGPGNSGEGVPLQRSTAKKDIVVESVAITQSNSEKKVPESKKPAAHGGSSPAAPPNVSTPSCPAMVAVAGNSRTHPAQAASTKPVQTVAVQKQNELSMPAGKVKDRGKVPEKSKMATNEKKPTMEGTTERPSTKSPVTAPIFRHGGVPLPKTAATDGPSHVVDPMSNPSKTEWMEKLHQPNNPKAMKAMKVLAALVQNSARGEDNNNVRRVILHNLPPGTTLKKLGMLIWGGVVQRIDYTPGAPSASVLFVNATGSDQYMATTRTGIKLMFGGQELLIVIERAKEREARSKQVLGWDIDGFTRCIKVEHIPLDFDDKALVSRAASEGRLLEGMQARMSDDGKSREALFRFASINDADAFRRFAWNDLDGLLHCEISFGPDPCDRPTRATRTPEW